MSSKNKLPKLKLKVAQTKLRCPCCGETLNIEVSPFCTDFLIDEEQEEIKIQNALKKNGIELASMDGGE